MTYFDAVAEKAIASAQEDYAKGLIEVDELERRIDDFLRGRGLSDYAMWARPSLSCMDGHHLYTEPSPSHALPRNER